VPSTEQFIVSADEAASNTSGDVERGLAFGMFLIFIFVCLVFSA
jgi:hypothetical protein